MTDSPASDSYPPIADYGLISDLHSCALVSKAGSVDWCCFPRFDSSAVFNRLLDWRRGGYFQITARGLRSVTRRYLPGTKVLETTFRTNSGTATLTDFMPVHLHETAHSPLDPGARQQILRVLKCVTGSVRFTVDCRPRFDYGAIVPHAALSGEHSGFVHGGADALAVYCSSPLEVRDNGFWSEGTLGKGRKVYAGVSYQPGFQHEAEPLVPKDIDGELEETVRFWRNWAEICTYKGKYADAVLRSALTLKALTYAPSGGLVAAATMSLPETIGGVRNWDYRFTWVRDASFALYALVILGYTEEAKAFKGWLEWSTAGHAPDLQVMYGLAGERRLTEVEIGELEGYRKSRPVRTGNAAYSQVQLDIYGELLDSAHLYRKFVGEDVDPEYWEYLRDVVECAIERWREPDDGIWETRGGRMHFVFSKVWCWVALDRAIKAAKTLDLRCDLERWIGIRQEIRDEVLAKGYDAERGAFVQAYGSKNLDAAALMLPLVGFIKADDPRMRSTIEAIERELTSKQGFVYRYRYFDDGLAGGEGTFNICSFWLADNLILLGQTARARRLFEKLCDSANDLGLFSEETDEETGAMLGNFPQAFTHMAHINTAVLLDRNGRADKRGSRDLGEANNPRVK